MTLLSRRDFALALGAGTYVLAQSDKARANAARTSVQIRDVEITDPSDGRTIKVRLFAQAGSQRRKLGFIAFSHGANSSGAFYDALLSPLAASGFVIAAPTHVDSETNPSRADFPPAAVLATRFRDLHLISDARTGIARQIGINMHEFDADAAIIAGHSYGALLALYLVGAGQVPLGSGAGTAPTSSVSSLYRGAIAISPPGAVPGLLRAEQFDTIAKPILVTTGEKDVLPGFVPQWQTRLTAFERASIAPAFAAILPDVDHYFGGAIGRLTALGPPQTRSLEITAQIAGLFSRGFGQKERSALGDLTALVRRANVTSRFPQLDLRRRN